ncbi:MAG: hypothetical protein ACRCXZ_08205 [Patescibacteria group bacterium]
MFKFLFGLIKFTITMGIGSFLTLFLLIYFAKNQVGPIGQSSYETPPTEEYTDPEQLVPNPNKQKNQSSNIDYIFGQQSVQRIGLNFKESKRSLKQTSCNSFKTSTQHVTVRHCIQLNAPENGSDDSPVSLSSGSSINFGKPKVGPAYISRKLMNSNVIRTSPITITNVGRCSATFNILGNSDGSISEDDLIYAGQSGGLVSRNGKPIGTISTRIIGEDSSDENFKGSWNGTFVFKDCRVK